MALVILSALAWYVWATPRCKAWRIQRALVRDGAIKGSVVLRISDGSYVLTGSVADERSFIEASRITAEIVRLRRVVNETLVNRELIPVPPNKQIGIIDIFVNNRYDDSPDSLKQISAILKLPQFEVIPVEVDDTISKIIVRRYGFGPSDLPLSYRLVESAILALNGLSSPTGLKPGAIKVSILPHRAALPAVPPKSIPAQASPRCCDSLGLTSSRGQTEDG
jgi:hypothetical protein